jgi:tetraacyldisaccharide 4'-kinase
LLVRVAPTIVARVCPAGAAAATEAGADAIITDDGWQNPLLAKDFVIAVLDGPRGIGNGGVFRAGPLRAQIESHLDHADALLVVGPSRRRDLIRSISCCGWRWCSFKREPSAEHHQKRRSA